MADNIEQAYNAGGMSFTSNGMNPSEGLGRWWNNISGKTAENMFSAEEAEKARIWSSAEAKINRDWQTEMSNTAYQRQVEDMKKAGLNPAAVDGNGASTPSGAIPTASAAAAAGSGNGGILGLIASLGRAAIAGAVAKKLQINANRASGSSAAVNAISKETSSAMDAARRSEYLYQMSRRAANERAILEKGLGGNYDQAGISAEDLVNRMKM